MPAAALPSLIKAKEHSDAQNYRMKHLVLSQMMRANPDHFVIDSDDGKGIVGITHVDTGFRLHVPKNIIPTTMDKQAGVKGALKSVLGLSDEVKNPLFGKAVADQAKRFGSAIGSWGGTTLPYASLKEGLKAEKALLKEYGIPGLNIFGTKSSYGLVDNLKDFKGVLADYQGLVTPTLKKMINSRGGTIIRSNVNAANTALLENKGFEAKLLSQAGGAKALDVAEALTRAGVSRKARKITPAQAAKVLEDLRQQSGGKFILKPTTSNASIASTLISDKTSPQDAATSINNGLTNLFGDSIGKGGPHHWLGQERMKIKKMPWIDRFMDNRGGGYGLLESLSGKPLGIHSLNQEMRVHALAGKVIPYASNWRGTSESPLSNLIGFFSRHSMRNAERQAQRTLDALPPQFREGNYGLDMVRTNKGWKPLELNVSGGGGSGYLTYGDINSEAMRASLEGVLPASEVTRRLQRSMVLGGTGAGALGLAGGWKALHSDEKERTKKASDDEYENLGRDALMGAGIGATLPGLTHAKYEAWDVPMHRRAIRKLVDQAVAEKKIYGSPVGYAEWRNPLQRKMKLGDIIVQSHTGDSLKEMWKTKGLDFTTLANGGSGSPFTHAAVSSRTGRAIDPGKDGLVAFKDGLMALAGKPNKINRSKLQNLMELRKIHPRSVADAMYLAREGTDAFESAGARPNISVVLRPQNLSGIKDSVLQKNIADIKSVGYSQSEAAIAGLKRMLIPFSGWRKQRQAGAGLLGGTFCSHGACSVQAMRGLKVPSFNSVLPPDLLKTKGQDLLGIGVNQTAIKSLGTLGKGLGKYERLGAAAKKTMLNTLRQSTSTRRAFAGVLTTLLGGAGMVGGVIGNRVMAGRNADE